MLTRLEVDGFKNLHSVAIEFGAFTCIAGENSTGKSNVFDAIEFLSLLSSRTLMEAAQELRSTSDNRSGDPRDLFWRGTSHGTAGETANPKGRNGPLIRLAAEMIVPPKVEDDFGRQARASITFVRYEVDIGYEPASGLEKIGRLVLVREELKPIKIREAHNHLGFKHSKKKFRDHVVTGRRSGAPFISTQEHGGDRMIVIHQDGGSRGKPKPASAARAPTTVVSTITGADDPTILAARREMQSWRQLALEPSALRASNRYSDPGWMAANGRHLAATLRRIATHRPDSGADPDPDGVYARIVTRLSSLTGLGVRGVRVDEDDTRELFTLMLEEWNGIELSARSLSEGTLRFLALAVLAEDPDARGVICLEEPENGIHPGYLHVMADLLRDLSCDPHDKPGEGNPFRQVIVNTHSPFLVQLLEPDELLFATSDTMPCGNGAVNRSLRLAPLKKTWREVRSSEAPISIIEILPYLAGPADSKLSLEKLAG